jgi:hypothetical protein
MCSFLAAAPTHLHELVGGKYCGILLAETWAVAAAVAEVT